MVECAKFMVIKLRFLLVLKGVCGKIIYVYDVV